MEGIYCGIVWDNNGTARHELAAESGLLSVPLSEGVPMPDGEYRCCTGYYDFGQDSTGVHVLCRQGATVSSGHQCRACQFQEGFVALHRARSMRDVPPQLRHYIAQEHILYLATFGPGIVKVGTAARSRHPARWYEQGALAALELETVRDGIEVRRLEATLSRAYGLTQALRGATKTKLLAHQPSMDELSDGLRETVGKMAAGGDTFAIDSVWQGPLSTLMKRFQGISQIRIVPIGSADWDMTGGPDAVGQCLMWDGPSGGYLMDVKPLMGKRVYFTTDGTGGESQQIALF